MQHCCIENRKLRGFPPRPLTGAAPGAGLYWFWPLPCELRIWHSFMHSGHQARELSNAQRARVDSLLDELLDLPVDQRIAGLHSRRIDDPAVADEVESLLRAAGESIDFLAMPARPFAQQAEDHTAIGTRVGPWRIIRLIGFGGMGEVYEAIRVQGDFEQRVAIKLLQREATAQLERFQAERQILARLEHPGIARLYDGGRTVDDRPFMVMEYVEGRAITEFCTQIHANLEGRLNLFIQVCDAVAYAHQNLIVHRDLKPSNIFVNTNGVVKLLDFGIAKLIDPHGARVTRTASAALTPICAAPEQLTGGVATTATDVYALGLLLFELLTGTHPWAGTGAPILQAMRTVLKRPAPVASVTATGNAQTPIPARSIRGDLDVIIAKALRIEPSHRYRTVESLKLEIERVLNGDPIEARKDAQLYVLGRLLRRYRWAAGAAAVTVIAALAALAWQAHRAALERDTARRENSRAEAVRHNLTRLFQGSSPESLIDSNAERALHELHDRPELAGQSAMTLAGVYGELEHVTGTASLLEGFIAQSGGQADPAALADARQKLAEIELIRGQLNHAGELLDQADAFWSSSPRPYLEERQAGLVVRARLQRARGDVDGSIALTREAIAQQVALNGHDHPETALLYNALAIALTSANRLDDALVAYREADAIYGSLGLRSSFDAQIVAANRAILEMRMGHLRVAEVALKSAVEQERSLAGESEALAAAMGYYGKVLAITNRNEQALAVLGEAVDISTRNAGPDDPLSLQNQLFLGETQAAAGDLTAATAMLNDVRVAALVHYGAADPLVLRTQIGIAQVAAKAGDYETSVSQLASAIVGLRKLGARDEIYLAQALELLGDVELSVGRTPQASTALLEALAIRERTPGDTWELAEVRERYGEALAKDGRDGAVALLDKAARDLESQLGATNPETLRAKAALAHARG
jgi:eukaryotic-like serine/threonine-protein kinase